jgi:transposase-like protein
MSLQKVEYYPKCGSTNIIKKGFYNLKNNKKQRYFCKDCEYKFQSKIELPSWVKNLLPYIFSI